MYVLLSVPTLFCVESYLLCHFLINNVELSQLKILLFYCYIFESVQILALLSGLPKIALFDQFYTLLKVSKSQKQIMVSSILPKNERNHYPEYRRCSG